MLGNKNTYPTSVKQSPSVETNLSGAVVIIYTFVERKKIESSRWT